MKKVLLFSQAGQSESRFDPLRLMHLENTKNVKKTDWASTSGSKIEDKDLPNGKDLKGGTPEEETN